MNFVERFSLAGRTALVSGASRGIGLEICSVLADAGADIVAVARDAKGLTHVQEKVAGFGRRCFTVEADLATVDGAHDAAQQALAEFDVIDILVNNAGIAVTDSILDTRVEDWDRVMAVNLRAPFILTQALGPKMIEQQRGKIINISSQTGIIALDDHAAYAASKNGLNALTKSVTCEWAKHNIQCNAICPTVILTPMGERVWGEPSKGDPMKAKIPAGRFGRPVEVADLVLYLASGASDLVNGDTIMMDGGFTAI